MTDPIDDASKQLARAQAFALGTTAKARAAALAAWRARGVTPSGIRGFGFGPQLVAKKATGATALRMHVADKLSPAALGARGLRAFPSTVAGIPTDVVETARGASSPDPGTSIKSALGSVTGSLACIIEIGGKTWVLGASHVLAPSNVGPQCGDSIWIGSGPKAALEAWTPVAPFATIHVDAAIASTSLVATSVWPDDTSFAGTRAYDPGNGPFTFYGATSGTRSADGQDIVAGNVSLSVPGVGVVLYAGHALLGKPSAPGDSGAAVRDVDGYLVGMVIGSTTDGRACVTPWQAMEPVLESLAST